VKGHAWLSFGFQSMVVCWLIYCQQRVMVPGVAAIEFCCSGWYVVFSTPRGLQWENG